MAVKDIVGTLPSTRGMNLGSYMEKRRLRKAGSHLRRVMNLTASQAELLAETNRKNAGNPALASFHFSLLRQLDQFTQGTPQHEAAFAQVIDIIRSSKTMKKDSV